VFGTDSDSLPNIRIKRRRIISIVSLWCVSWNYAALFLCFVLLYTFRHMLMAKTYTFWHMILSKTYTFRHL